MTRNWITTVISGIFILLIGACGDNNTQDMPAGNTEENNENSEENTENNEEADSYQTPEAEAELIDTDENVVGTVSFYDSGDGTIVEADLDGLDNGYHGFHLHEEAVCEPDEEEPFDSAEGHYNPDDESHGEHAGDMPPLYANEEGTAYMAVKLDTFTAEQLLEDGVAVMVHEDPDNLGHIPDRYQSEDSDDTGPDEETLDTGDAGDRFACGVVEESN